MRVTLRPGASPQRREAVPQRLVDICSQGKAWVLQGGDEIQNGHPLGRWEHRQPERDSEGQGGQLPVVSPSTLPLFSPVHGLWKRKEKPLGGLQGNAASSWESGFPTARRKRSEKRLGERRFHCRCSGIPEGIRRP